MEVLETGIPTYLLVILLPFVLLGLTIWKLKFNGRVCFMILMTIAGIASIGFGLGELISYNGKVSEPLLTFSQGFALLFSGVAIAIIGSVGTQEV